MAINRIRRKKVWEEVAEELQRLIVDGHWQKGEQLPSEIELAKEFGVSRSALREALRSLSSMGLVQIRHGEGNFVWYPEAEDFLNPLMPRLLADREDVLAIMEARSMVEVKTAMLAAQRATPEMLAEMEKLLEKMEESRYDREKFARYDHRFHKQIALATQNNVIVKIFEAIEVFLVSQQLEIVYYNDAIERGITDHRAIMAAIRAGDPAKAAEEMDAHMERTYKAILENTRKEELH